MPMCTSNKVTLQLYWNHFSAWLFSCKFAAYFQNIFSQEYLWTAASDYCKALHLRCLRGSWPRLYYFYDALFTCCTFLILGNNENEQKKENKTIQTMLYSALWTCYCFDSDFHTKELSTLIEANFAQLLQSFRFSLRFVKRRSSQKLLKFSLELQFVSKLNTICIKIEQK